MIDILDLTIRQLDVALASGMITKKEILTAAQERGATMEVLCWLSEHSW